MFEKIKKTAHVMKRNQKKVCVSYHSGDENDNWPKNGCAKVSVSYESVRKNQTKAKRKKKYRFRTIVLEKVKIENFIKWTKSGRLAREWSKKHES